MEGKTEVSSSIVENSPKKGELVDRINQLWQGSRLEGKSQVLIDACSTSKVPDTCVKVLASQIRFETNYGSTGTGKLYNNLTGIQCKGGSGRNAEANGWSCKKMVSSSTRVWIVYPTLEDSLRDSARLFIQGNYQDFFTGGFNICGHVKLWGTNQCGKIQNYYNQI